MARTGGRNTVFAWFVGIVSVTVVGALVWFAAPAFPAVAVWIGDQYRNATGTAGSADPAEETPTAAPSPAAAPVALPADCAALYPETLWALLSSTAGATLSESDTIPDSATDLAEALEAGDVLTCRWSIPTGPAITTLVATVPEDAPDIAATFLGSRQFACTADGVSTVCARDADGRIVTHDVRDGLWVMSVQRGWRPPQYSETVAARIWGR